MTAPDCPAYLFDTVALSNFCLSGTLELLERRYGARLGVTAEELSEIAEGVAAGYADLREIETLNADGCFTTVILTANERKTFGELLRPLGSGEASCIAAAATRGAVVVTDDSAARSVCADHEVACTGTLGILKASCDDGMISLDRADDILQTMIDHGFYSPVRRLRDLG